MRRLRMALLGLIPVAGFLISAPASQASSFAPALVPGNTTVHMSAGVRSAAIGSHSSASAGTLVLPISGAPQTRTARITLAPAQCAALRHKLDNHTASCAGFATARLSAARTIRGAALARLTGRPMAAASGTYATGWAIACSDNPCANTGSGFWTTELDFGITYIYNVGVWNNWVNCPSSKTVGTNVTWCSYYHNGYSWMQEGEDFGKGGTLRVRIWDNGTYRNPPVGASWEWVADCLSATGQCNTGP